MNTKHVRVYQINESLDKAGTLYVLELSDGNLIECGAFSHNGLTHLCISSQVGCSLGCTHCATTYSSVRYVRDLTQQELLDICRMLLDMSQPLTLPPILSFSGHGEPLLNWGPIEGTFGALCPGDVPRCYVTTVGIRSSLASVLQSSPELLAVYISLHGPTDVYREIIVPRHPVVCNCDELHAFGALCLSQSRRVVFNYVLTKDNTTTECISQMDSFFDSKLAGCELRLCQLNRVIGSKVLPAEEHTAGTFYEAVKDHLPHIGVRMTRSVGDKCGIACGQLRARAKR
jgi:23S rRNA (adenine2503-C2)-methyltransferase